MHVSPALLLQWRCLLFSPILLMNAPRPRELGINSTRSDYWPVAGQGFWPKFVSISIRWYCISFIWNSCAFSTSTSISPIKSQQLFVEKLQDFLRRDERLCPQVALWKCNWADQHNGQTQSLQIVHRVPLQSSLPLAGWWPAGSSVFSFIVAVDVSPHFLDLVWWPEATCSLCSLML